MYDDKDLDSDGGSRVASASATKGSRQQDPLKDEMSAGLSLPGNSVSVSADAEREFSLTSSHDDDLAMDIDYETYFYINMAATTNETTRGDLSSPFVAPNEGMAEDTYGPVTGTQPSSTSKPADECSTHVDDPSAESGHDTVNTTFEFVKAGVVYGTFDLATRKTGTLSMPFLLEDITHFTKGYLDQSPFFTNLFRDFQLSHGTYAFTKAVNAYMSASDDLRPIIRKNHPKAKKQGTKEYYQDWLLGTRRRRDDFVDCLNQLSAELDDGKMQHFYPPVTAFAEAETNVTGRQDETPAIITTKEGGMLTSPVQITMGENANELKTLLRRYTKAYTTNTQIKEHCYAHFHVSPCMSGVNQSYKSPVQNPAGYQYRTTICHFSELYTMWRGSLRYMITFEHDPTINLNARVYFVPGAANPKGGWFFTESPASQRRIGGQLEAQGVLLFNGHVQRSIHFEVPFYSPFLQLLTLQTGENITSATHSTGTVMVELSSSKAGVAVVMDLYQAAGDDFELLYLRAAPNLRFEKGWEGKRDLLDSAQWLYSGGINYTDIKAEAEQVNTIDRIQNTTLTAQRETVVDEGYVTGTTVTQSMQKMSMQEGEWHVRDILAKPILNKSIVWNVNDAPNKRLWSAYVPGDLIRGQHENVLRTMTYLGGYNMQIDILVNTNKFNAGTLLVVYVPFDTWTGTKDQDPLYNMGSIISYPHVLINATESNTGRLIIPFVHLQTYFNLVQAQSYSYQGRLYVYVWNQLRAISSSTPRATVSLWASFQNAEVHQPCASHTLALYTTPKIYAEAGVEGLIKSVANMALPAASSLVPGLGAVLPGLTSTLGNVMGGAQNCDKPTKTNEIPRWVPNVASEINYGDGLDQCTRLSLLHNAFQISDSSVTKTTQDDMNLMTLARMWNRVELKGWKTSDPTEAELITFPVYPCWVNSKVESKETRYDMNMLAYISRAFKYYRGSIEYKLVAANSVMNSGRLLITFTAGFKPSNYAVANLTNAVVWDLQERHEITFSVPFMNYRPWERCDKLITQEESETMGKSMPWLRGWIGIWVLNNLTSPDAGVQNVDINIMTRAGPDFEVAFPADFSYCIGIGMEQPAEKEALPRAEMFNAAREALNVPRNINKTLEAASNATNTANKVIARVGGVSPTGLPEETEEEGGESSEDPDGNPVTPAITALASALGSSALPPGLSGSIMNWTIRISRLVAGFNSYLQAGSLFVKACSIVTVVSELFGSALDWVKTKLMDVATHIITFMNGSKQGNELPRAEAEFLSFLPALLGVIGCGALAIGHTKIPNDKQTQEMVRGINDKLRLFNSGTLALNNIKKLYEMIKGAVDYVIDYVLGYCAPEMLARLKLKRGFENIEEFARKVDTILDDSNYVNRTNMDVEYRLYCLELEDHTDRLNTLLITGKLGREASIIREYIRKAKEIIHAVKESYYKLPSRVDPFCVCIHGDPGIGKSTLTNELAFRIMDELHYPQTNRWCALNTTETFFSENYDHQHAVYLDDISAFTKEEQYMNFFNLKSNNSFPLNMASLEKKGTYFTSEFIFTTTNFPYPRPNCINEINAFYRRRDALVEARWRRGAPREKTTNFRNLEFRIRDSVDPVGPSTPWRNYEEISRVLIEKARRHMNEQRALVRRQLQLMHYPVPEGMFERIEVPTYRQPPEEFVDARPEGVQDRKMNMDLVYNHPNLSLVANLIEEDSFIWNEVISEVFNAHDHSTSQVSRVVYKTTTSEEVQQDLIEAYERLGLTHAQLIRDLYSCTYDPTTIAKKEQVKEKFAEFKKYISKAWDWIVEKFVWAKEMMGWPFMLAAGLGALALMGNPIARLAHKCACSTATFFGYRCSICGRWPAWEKCKDKEWLKQEWESLYSDKDYEDYKVTSPDEEEAYMQASGMVSKGKPWIGTHAKKAEGGPYSQDVKGQPRLHVIAQSGPYSQDVKGHPKLQILAETQLEQIMNNRIIPYTYRIRTGTLSMNCFAFGDRYVMLPKHFYDDSLQHDFCEIYHSNAWMPFRWEDGEVSVMEGKDLVIFKMPIQFHQHKDMLTHFISEKDLGYLKTCTAQLARQHTPHQVILENLKVKGTDAVKYILETMRDGKPVDIEYFSRSTWSYPHQQSPGACGSVLVVKDGRFAGKIIGFHIAGGGGRGWAQLVTKEMVNKHMDAHLGTPLPPVITTDMKIRPEGHFGLVGTVEKGVSYSTKTSIIPTEIHDMIRPHVTEPSVQRNDDPRLERPTNILKKGIEKYGQVSIPFNKSHMDMVFESLEAHIDTWELQRQPEILTQQQAVLGIPEYEGFDRLPMNTSPGYPFVLSRPKGEMGKAYMFDQETGDIIDEELKKAYSFRAQLAEKGERVVSLWTINPKDERRPMAKIAAGSTRLFSIPPVDYTILMRQYTLDFTVAMKDNRHKSFAQVGIDPQSMEWTIMYDRLREFSPFVMAGDFTRFDGTLPPDVQERFREHLKSFLLKNAQLTTEQKIQLCKVIDTMMDELIHTVHICKDSIFVNHTGNESGCPITVVINSVANFYYLALAWLGIMSVMKPEWATMEHFRRLVLTLVYGDDNLVAIKWEAIELFNQITVSQFLAKYNITYTNAEKSGLTKYMKLEKATFLKNGFKPHEQMHDIVVPTMDENTIYELLNWTRKAPDQDELLTSNINDALRFAYFYGQNYFNTLRSEIMTALKQVDKMDLEVLTYSDFHYWFLWVCGKLERKHRAESFFEAVARNGNGYLSRLVNKTIFGLPYKILSHSGILRKDQQQPPTDDRHAIAIPSGEGKSWLCRNYPNLFVDHDELLLPAARQQLKGCGISIKAIHKIFDLEFPQNDRRVLLCHHPDNTRRKVIGCFKLPKPAWIRANFLQRAMMKNATVLDRDIRNQHILGLVRFHEPDLFKSLA